MTLGRLTPFAHAFRSFFLLGALWSAAALALWMGVVSGHTQLGGSLPPAVWHGHAMVFGFGGAIVAGFVLTAAPIWTGQPRPQGAALAALAGLWLAGRVALLTDAAVVGAVLDTAFPLAVAVWTAKLIVAGRSWRNLPVVLVLAGLTGATALVHLQSLGLAATAALGNRLAVAGIAFLAALIGGRIVPAFTRNWLRQTGRGGPVPSEPADLDRLALVLTAAALVTWALAPAHALTGVLAGCAGAAALWRMAAWRGWRTGAEPLLAILHLGYLWLPVSFAMMVLVAAGAVPDDAALHALTAGLMGTLMLAMMTRVPRGHTGRSLHADAATTAVYALVLLAGVARVVAGITPGLGQPWLTLAAAAWIAAFAGYALRHAPMLLTPRPDEV